MNIIDMPGLMLRDAERARHEKRRWRWAGPCSALAIAGFALWLLARQIGVA